MKRYKDLFESAKRLSGPYAPRTMLGKKVLDGFISHVKTLKNPSAKEVETAWKSWSKTEGAKIVKTFILSKNKNVTWIGFTGPSAKWKERWTKPNKVSHEMLKDFLVHIEVPKGSDPEIAQQKKRSKVLEFAPNSVVGKPDLVYGKRKKDTITLELNDSFVLVFGNK